VVYDLLPVLLPQVFPEGTKTLYQQWISVIAQFDGVVAISCTVANEFAQWLKASGLKRKRPLAVGWFYLGADVEHSVPTTGLPFDAQHVLDTLTTRPTFLMVGTIEPRKGHAQTLEAFEQLWTERVDVNLVIVGKQGWMVEALVDKLRTHPERGKRLFWLEGISDEYLEKVYAASTCLIAASYGEGFGLPLIEAAQHRLPIIARRIPVFREVAGDHAFYFADSRDPAVIAKAVRDWLSLRHAGTHPTTEGLKWHSWQQSAEHLLEVIGL
jgi:glycosyltransferase involved in cell wall biosynthesis